MGLFYLICVTIIVAAGVKKCQGWLSGPSTAPAGAVAGPIDQQQVEHNAEENTYYVLHKINQMPSSTEKSVYGADCLMAMHRAENKTATWVDAHKGCMDSLTDMTIAASRN